MINANGWPGEPGVPLNPERDGAHWIIGWKGKLFVAEWDSTTEDWSWGGGAESAVGVVEVGWGYAGPCLTPTEVEAKVKAAVSEAKTHIYSTFTQKGGYQPTSNRSGPVGPPPNTGSGVRHPKKGS